jgi:hypothetical protein
MSGRHASQIMPPRKSARNSSEAAPAGLMKGGVTLRTGDKVTVTVQGGLKKDTSYDGLLGDECDSQGTGE